MIHVRFLSGASGALWLCFLDQSKTAMMRQIGIHATKTSENADGRLGRVRAVFFGFVAFVMALQGLALASPAARSASQEGVVAAVAVECAQEDTRSPAGDGRPHKCSPAGLCCLASCDGRPSFGLAGAAFNPAFWSRWAADAVKPHAPARSRLALAGWASAWSARAPPRHA